MQVREGGRKERRGPAYLEYTQQHEEIGVETWEGDTVAQPSSHGASLVSTGTMCCH